MLTGVGTWLDALDWSDMWPVLLALLGLGTMVAAVFLRRLIAQFLREPVGLGVPLAAAVLVFIAPQMPDMLVDGGLGASGINAGRPWGMPLASALLGFLGWYWTRAAVNAPHAVDDHRKGEPRRQLDWPIEALPRCAWALALLIAASPVLVTWIAIGTFPRLSLVAVTVVGLFGIGTALWYVAKRRKDGKLVARRPPPVWMWRCHTTSLLAAAPMGWPMALFLLLLSFTACAVVGFRPNWVDQLHAPAAALAAMALSIGPLSLTLAVLRDLCWLILAAFCLLLQRDRSGLRPAARWLGVAALAVLTYAPFGGWEAPGRYEVRPLLENGVTVTDRVAFRGGNCDAMASGRVDLRCAVEAWYAARSELMRDREGQRMPLIIVATEGGASRAAVWTLSAMRVLDLETQGRFGAHLFGISAVSGGALGAASYLLALREHLFPRPEPGASEDPVAAPSYRAMWERSQTRNLVIGMAGADLLAPSIATFFLNDTLMPVWGPLWPFGGDRGIALEGSFERHWMDRAGLAATPAVAQGGFLALRRPNGRDSPALPHLLLNGTERKSGRRTITSSIRFDPEHDWMAAEDMLSAMVAPTVDTPREDGVIQSVSVLRDENARRRSQSAVQAILRAQPEVESRQAIDIRLSTAVLNAARFPFISPAGRYQSQGTEQQVLDGGYFENYGARTALELATAIERLPGIGTKVLPIVVLISNDADGWVDLATATRFDSDIRQETDDRLLHNRTMHCGWEPTPINPSDLASRGAGGSSLPQLLAPLAGLYATRGAHGQAMLLSLRRAMCGDRAEPDSERREPDRLFHIALPRPRPYRRGEDAGTPEAAPMNWVLNPAAQHFLLRVGPPIAFNCRQAKALAALLEGRPADPASVPAGCNWPSLLSP